MFVTRCHHDLLGVSRDSSDPAYGVRKKSSRVTSLLENEEQDKSRDAA